MAKTGQNVDIYQGDYRQLVVTVYDEDGAIQPLDSILHITWVVYKIDPFPGTTVLTKSLGSGITITDSPNGIFTIDLNPADTQELYKYYRHECEVVDDSGHPVTIFTGYFKVYLSKANYS